MSDTQLPKALQLAELMQAEVQTYPQQSEDEPGGYCTQVDQLLDEASAELIRLDARETELLHHVCVLQGMNDESLESIRALTAELEQARAALAAQGEPVGEVFTMEALGTPGKPFCHVLLNRTLPTGTKLYTEPPAPAASVSDEQIDAHLDNILRAAGSALRHYTMQKSKDDMRAALRNAILALRPAQAGVQHFGWAYDFLDGVRIVNDWVTSSKDEAFKPGHFNQRELLAAASTQDEASSGSLCGHIRVMEAITKGEL